MPSGVYVARVEDMVTDDVFAVIAEATRRDILVSLREGDKAVGELVEELAASQPTISKHLKVLREARPGQHARPGPEALLRAESQAAGGRSPAGWKRSTSAAVRALPVPRPGVTDRCRRAAPSAGIPDASGSPDGRRPPGSCRTACCRAAAQLAAQPAPRAGDRPRAAAEPRRRHSRRHRAPLSDDTVPQQIGRTVGRAATKAADLLANLPKFGRRVIRLSSQT